MNGLVTREQIDNAVAAYELRLAGAIAGESSGEGARLVPGTISRLRADLQALYAFQQGMIAVERQEGLQALELATHKVVRKAG